MLETFSEYYKITEYTIISQIIRNFKAKLIGSNNSCKCPAGNRKL